MGKREGKLRQVKAEKTNFSRLVGKVKKKGKNKGALPSTIKNKKSSGGSGKRVEAYGFDLTNCQRPHLEKIPPDVLQQMCFVRGQGRNGNKQQLIESLLAFKIRIQTREVREMLYAQYLARCSKVYSNSTFSARGSVLEAIKTGGGAKRLSPANKKVPNMR